jgi:NAD(P)H-flavin reductase
MEIDNERLDVDLHRLTMRVAPEVTTAFNAPGQYHWVRLAQLGEAPFAIASPPGRGEFDYLVRRTSPLTLGWTDLEPGAPVEVSLPEGRGFPLDVARGRPLWLVATGTGWAPIRAVLATVLRERTAWGPVRAVYGAHSPAQLAWAREFEHYQRAGIEVVPTVTSATPTWRGAVGRVQRHLGVPPPGAVAFLCGQAEMMTEVTALLAERGLPPEQVFLNA